MHPGESITPYIAENLHLRPTIHWGVFWPHLPPEIICHYPHCGLEHIALNLDGEENSRATTAIQVVTGG
jgi:hypothetical protein